MGYHLSELVLIHNMKSDYLPLIHTKRKIAKGQEETMQSKTPAITSKLPGSRPTHKIAGLIIFLVWTCITPVLFGQQDVHAALIPPANRKSAPAFQLVTEDGKKMQLS